MGSDPNGATVEEKRAELAEQFNELMAPLSPTVRRIVTLGICAFAWMGERRRLRAHLLERGDRPGLFESNDALRYRLNVSVFDELRAVFR